VDPQVRASAMAAPSARLPSTSASHSITASRESSRRLSHKIVTSSGVGGTAWRIRSITSSAVSSRGNAINSAYCSGRSGSSVGRPSPHRTVYRRAIPQDGSICQLEMTSVPEWIVSCTAIEYRPGALPPETVTLSVI